MKLENFPPRDCDAQTKEIGNLKNISEIGNRKLAIKKAISELKRGDLLLIAGKGHEKFQSIMGKKFPFDDVKIAEKYLQKK